jgi:hypothetical protein
MSTTYRCTINVDDHRTRYMSQPGFTYTVRRRTAKTDAEALSQFRALLRTHCAWGAKAHAWLDVSGRYGSEALAKVTGKITSYAHYNASGCPSPSACDWIVSSGVNEGQVLARCGVQC